MKLKKIRVALCKIAIIIGVQGTIKFTFNWIDLRVCLVGAIYSFTLFTTQNHKKKIIYTILVHSPGGCFINWLLEKLLTARAIHIWHIVIMINVFFFGKGMLQLKILVVFITKA